MMNNDIKQTPIIIGVGGISRAGKDTFVKIARKILKEHGYSSIKLAFADELKEELDEFTTKKYGISSWTNDSEEKTLIRRSMVSHGCIMRDINPNYWIEKIDKAIEEIHFNEDVIFISDCRFPNEVEWLQNNRGGWFVHVRKYSVVDMPYHNERLELVENKNKRIYDKFPNEEEAKNDPLCKNKANICLELENVIEREFRLTGNKITVNTLIDNTYLNEEIKLCLMKCPLLQLNITN